MPIPQPQHIVRASPDDAWKEALRLYFEPFIAHFFPAIHVEVDWARGYQFLDKELASIGRGHTLGRRVADKLAQVYLKNGKRRWLLIHLEIQGEPRRRFNERMYVYNYRLFDRFHVKVVSLAVLISERAHEYIGRYRSEQWGCHVDFQFPVARLREFKQRQAELEASRNPFAVLVLAQLKALEARGDNARKFAAKRALIFGLHERGFSRIEIAQLVRLIDWVIALPTEMEDKLEHEVYEYQKENKLLLTSWEVKAMKKSWYEGLEQGFEQLILAQLAQRFGPLSARLQTQIRRLPMPQLQKLGQALLDFSELKQLRDWLALQKAAPKNGNVRPTAKSTRKH